MKEGKKGNIQIRWMTGVGRKAKGRNEGKDNGRG